ncbi:autotransporter outer membrane beta-barrel domain-containing protein [Cetobacterium sp. SF1]|uniref:autotransporter outer membrane beta-barrel domain-containing protein n=1 Tax=Cetobacterium sp. SF1 TaxID=3417654 RepID=UPI003CE7A3C7
MKSKWKILLLTSLIGSLAQGATLPKPNPQDAEIIINGEDHTGSLRPGRQLEIEGGNYGASGGGTPSRLALYLENKGTFINRGNIFSENQQYNTNLIGVLIGGIQNNLYKEDNLVQMASGSNLENYGTIEMGSLTHDLSSNGITIGGSVTGYFANYTKSMIKAEGSNIYNRDSGKLILKGDTFSYTTHFNVDVLTYTDATYRKNVVELGHGSRLINDGLIEQQSSYNPQLQSYVGVNLLKLGLRYNRYSHGVNSINSYIENNGTINIQGDVYKSTSTGGLDLSLLGADFIGYHEKYGVYSQGGTVVNNGTIDVQRDFTKMEVNGTLVDATVMDGPLLGLGILSYKNMTEKSVGVHMEGGTFINNGGTIKVGANSKETLIGTGYAAIALEGNHGATMEVNGGNIILDGASIFVSNLQNGSYLVFKGDTTVTSTKSGKDVNTALFANDSTSKHVIEGNLTVNGDLQIKKENNINISINDKNQFGNLTVNHLQMDGDVGVDVGKLTERKINNISAEKLIVAKNGISGNGQLISDNYMFNIEQNRTGQFTKSGEEYIGINVRRKNFQEIVSNPELGNALENIYENGTGNQEGLYELLAQAKNESEFDSSISQLTGERNINNLGFQVYNINKELNDNFYDFSKENINSQGIHVSYINSKSSIDSSNSSDGFKRKSNGIIVGYNIPTERKIDYGVGFAYVNSNVDYDSNGSKNKIETWNFRGYRNEQFKGLNLFSELTFGTNKSKNNRNFVVGDFVNPIKGHVNIYTFGLNNNIWKEFKVNDKFSIIPNGGINLTYLVQRDYKENSGKYTVDLDKVNSFFGEGILGTGLNYQLYKNDLKTLNLFANGSYGYDFVNKSGDLKEKINVLNDSEIKIEGRKLDRNSVKVEIGLRYDLGNGLNVNYSYTREVLNKVHNNLNTIGINYKF